MNERVRLPDGSGIVVGCAVHVGPGVLPGSGRRVLLYLELAVEGSKCKAVFHNTVVQLPLNEARLTWARQAGEVAIEETT